MLQDEESVSIFFSLVLMKNEQFSLILVFNSAILKLLELEEKKHLELIFVILIVILDLEYKNSQIILLYQRIFLTTKLIWFYFTESFLYV